MKATAALGLVLSLVATVAVSARNDAKTSTAAEQHAGKKLLQSRCGHCHSVTKTGQSPLATALPLRDVYRTYPIEQLAFELSEGIGSRHKSMPQIQFSSEEIDQILAYLQGIIRND